LYVYHTACTGCQDLNIMETKHISVTGIVQGVGFRPFVYGLATRLGLNGWVRNTSAGVEIVVQGEPDSVAAFIESIPGEIPPLARIDSLRMRAEPNGLFERFEIRESESVEGAFQPISADTAICPDCERELFDPNDRRYLYPFINCTNCGPRFTIIKDIPYDRPATTMADFELCRECHNEYENPLDRRFHAQPVACAECGPGIWLERKGKMVMDVNRGALLSARRLLREGRIVAIKGLGGFHLACDAANPAAVDELRRRKGRIGKPFALMAANLSMVEQLCFVGDTERILLTGHEKPIVLLTRRPGIPMADSVAPGVDTLGLMLPYTPLHHLLLNQSDPVLAAEPVPVVLVMTSGNFSEEPIATGNQEALERLEPLADAFLLHNRDIHTRCDDSVVRVDQQRSSVIHLRRSRGFSPYPVQLPFDTRPTLAVGGELKNTFCLTRDRYAFLSHHIGDMENAEVYQSFEQGVEHLSRLFRIEPELIAYDLHPNYFTTAFAQRSTLSVQRVGVQHHHAHIAACMVDNGLDNRKVIGLSFDGTGFGTDGTIWGGEVLLADYADFERFAHLEYLPLPGGDAAIRKPWRIAVGYASALGLAIDDLPFIQTLDEQALIIVRQQVEKNLNAPLTSSMGRLFDVVAVLAGVRTEVTYEAQAVIELETFSRSKLSSAKPYPFVIDAADGKYIIRLRDLLTAAIADSRWHESPGLIGARFHLTVAEMTRVVCRKAREQTGIGEVALSGGVWQNQLLLDLVRDGLENDGFTVYFHQQTPTNDGGLALGQAMIANFQK
jgi:hydrogenase maturation protein HypF